MSARHSDMVKEIVLALIAKAPSGESIESMLPGVLTAFGVISRELKELEEKEYAALRELVPPVVESPRRRAKPYRPPGYDEVEKPRLPTLRGNGSDQPGDGRIKDGENVKKRLDSGFAVR